MKKQKKLTHFTIAMLLLAGVFGTLQAEDMKTEEYPKSEEISGPSTGKFQSIKLINNLEDWRVKAKFNEDMHLEVTGIGEKILPIPVGGGIPINSLRIIMQNLERRENRSLEVDSKPIELNWKNSASVIQDSMNELKARDIPATVKVENKNILVISIG